MLNPEQSFRTHIDLMFTKRKRGARSARNENTAKRAQSDAEVRSRGENMVERTVLKEVKIRLCDYCGEEASGMYSNCDYCKKDICSKHNHIAGEEECICVECAKKKGLRK